MIHPTDKQQVDQQSLDIKENIKELLLQTVSLNDEIFQQKLHQMVSKGGNRFNQSLRFYRDKTQNPHTLSRKIYNLVLDPNGEYKKVKAYIKVVKAKQVQEQKEQLKIFRKSYIIKNPQERLNEMRTDMMLSRSKSQHELMNRTQTNTTVIKQKLENFLKFDNYQQFADQKANNSIFINTELKQDQSTIHKSNNYAMDLLRPNMNLPQYKQRLEQQKVFENKVQAKQSQNLSYLFKLPRNIFIQEGVGNLRVEDGVLIKDQYSQQDEQDVQHNQDLTFITTSQGNHKDSQQTSKVLDTKNTQNISQNKINQSYDKSKVLNQSQSQNHLKSDLSRKIKLLRESSNDHWYVKENTKVDDRKKSSKFSVYNKSNIYNLDSKQHSQIQNRDIDMSPIIRIQSQDLNNFQELQNMHNLDSQELLSNQVSQGEDVNVFDQELSESRRSSITSMDTNKMIKLNMQADNEMEDSQLLVKKYRQQRQKPNFRKTKSQANLKNFLLERSNFRFRMQPAYPKKQVEEYMKKFEIQKRQIVQTQQPNNLPQNQSKAYENHVSSSFQRDKQQLALFLSQSKAALDENQKQANEIIKRRERFQKYINKNLSKAKKYIASEDSINVHPSSDQMKEIRQEIRKLDSINADRVLYNIKFNRKIQEFKAPKVGGSEEQDYLQYRDKFLSYIDQNQQNQDEEDSDDSNYKYFDNQIGQTQNYIQILVQGLKEMPSFYNLKSQKSVLLTERRQLKRSLNQTKQ
eukprot:403362234